MQLFISSNKDLIVVSKGAKGWSVKHQTHPEGDIQSVAADPVSNALYAGTFDHGLWKSDDDGISWERIGKDLLPNRVMSVRVSPNRQNLSYAPLYVGTEPSELFQSLDGGDSWSSFPALLNLPSKSTWSFPPRPYTHHVRDIAIGYGDENFLLAGIELGGVMRSLDGGRSFEDRKEHSQYDCHTIKLHPTATERIYEAGGGGYAQSTDRGATWETQNDGLRNYSYLVHVAVDPGNPDTVVVSGAEGPRSAYRPDNANTFVFRRDSSNEAWERVTEGLPSSEGSTVLHLHTNPKEPNVFYGINNRGVYTSNDQGRTWESAPIEWPHFLEKRRITDVALKA
ncbi:photosystem II stability/assembly factor-like uncharacterized protein [Evansella vedderi]|uniref:Photosystem II stability/assembly factor-like uncharacterized protein n=1 Tax=Evansella vedderi TaxID=38282 RepID=A0ABT9ZRZ0_9BACI|nr:hypothetical protein [Evansella vedderi]MDQ0253993.1 photosystem II stability/assembly factor-like uncharacterized protein [Evansella vedderi]